MRYTVVAVCFALLLGTAHAAAPAPTPAPPPDKAAIIKANEKAAAENALIIKAMAALNAQKWQEAETILLQLVAEEPNDWQFQRSLGQAEFNLAKYAEAAAALGKAAKFAEAAAKATPPNAAAKAELGPILTMQGNAFVKLKKNKEAIAAFTRAAALDPHPAVAYFNVCAVAYNMGDMKAAAPACRKAIAADPKKADAYFIAGSVLYAADPKFDANNKMIVPEESLKDLRKYLELEPNGPHAGDVKAMLEAAGQPIVTTSKPAQ